MKVDIIYRCCGKELEPATMRPQRPYWFSKPVCFLSLMKFCQGLGSDFSLHVIYDGPSSPFLDFILKNRPTSLTRTNFGSNASISAQWPIADDLTGDFIYFLEDDYLHAPNAAKIFLEGASKFELFTLYDHPDRYTRTDDLMKGREEIFLTQSCHWRSAESTTSTWACSRPLWNDLREAAIAYGAHDRAFFRALIGRRLWTPMPGVSTHCMAEFLSPFVDWLTHSATL